VGQICRNDWCQRIALAMLTAGALACQRTDAPPSPAPLARATTPGPHVSMMVLHASGGVPPGWRFSLPPGSVERGRATFVDLGCPTCHAVGPQHPAGSGTGPDLAGMGSHHPAGYFAESILNPDAVIVEGAGYVGPDGRSIMPSYPDLTAGQLADLVTYLQSLRTGEAPTPMPAMPAVADPTTLPEPPPQRATVFYGQRYTVQQGQLPELAEWFRSTGARQLLGRDGLVSIETYVDAWAPSPALITIFGFASEADLNAFIADPAIEPIGLEFDRFLEPHDHRPFRRPPIYHVAELSAP